MQYLLLLFKIKINNSVGLADQIKLKHGVYSEQGRTKRGAYVHTLYPLLSNCYKSQASSSVMQSVIHDHSRVRLWASIKY